jgi:S-adenosylmethionine:tRNA-ribosyltransferase-isomerase (queuine synthetase)
VEPTEPTTAEINHDSAEANSKERETGNASAPVVLSDEQKVSIKFKFSDTHQKHLFDGMQISVIGKFSMPQNDFKKLIAEYGAVPLQKYVSILNGSLF